MQNDFSGIIFQMEGTRRSLVQLNHKPWDKTGSFNTYSDLKIHCDPGLQK